MKQFSITQLLLVVTWCAIAFFALSRYLMKPPYSGTIEDVAGLTFYDEGLNEEFETTIDVAAVRESPAWNPADPNPPVSAAAALSIADRFRRARIADRANWEWALASLSLYPLDSRNRKWCWRVQFVGYPKRGGLGGMPPTSAAYILMNGGVITPKVERVAD